MYGLHNQTGISCIKWGSLYKNGVAASLFSRKGSLGAFIHIEMQFPKLALAIWVLTVLYKGPCFLRGIVRKCRGPFMLAKTGTE